MQGGRGDEEHEAVGGTEVEDSEADRAVGVEAAAVVVVCKSCQWRRSRRNLRRRPAVEAAAAEDDDLSPKAKACPGSCSRQRRRPAVKAATAVDENMPKAFGKSCSRL
jgi:hypothetical protein